MLVRKKWCIQIGTYNKFRWTQAVESSTSNKLLPHNKSTHNELPIGLSYLRSFSIRRKLLNSVDSQIVMLSSKRIRVEHCCLI